MPSTGTASFTMTRDQMITSSLRALRVLQEGQAANAQMIADAAPILNMVIKKMMSDGLFVWTYQIIQIPCVEGKNFYTIGPVNADVIANRPLRLMDGTFIRNVLCQDQAAMDTPLRVISRLEYEQFGNKLTEGVPNSIYYDQQFNWSSNTTSPSTGWGTVFVYTNPIDSSRVIFCNFQRQLYDMSNASDEFDIPAEGFLAIRWNLAEQLADDYEVPEQRIQRVAAYAKLYREDLEEWSIENTPQNWTPDWAFQNRRAFR